MTKDGIEIFLRLITLSSLGIFLWMSQKNGAPQAIPALLLLGILFLTFDWVRSILRRSNKENSPPYSPKLPEPWELEERTRCLSEARTADMLDAAFLISLHNEDRARGSEQLKIVPQEIFSETPIDVIEDALMRVKKLLRESDSVAEAFYGYHGVTIPVEDGRKKFREENRGFSDKTYDRAVSRAMYRLR
jgi:hypothetical protein